MLSGHDIRELPAARRGRLLQRRFSTTSARRGVRALGDLQRQVDERLFAGRDSRTATWVDVRAAAGRVLGPEGDGTWSEVWSEHVSRWTPLPPPPEAEDEWPWGQGPASGSPVERAFGGFSISTPKLFHAEDATVVDDDGIAKSTESAFGTYDRISRDLDQLGAQVLWHPGKLQLRLATMFSDAAPIPVGETPIKEAVWASTELAHLGDYISWLVASGIEQQLLLTFATLGGGESPLDVTDPDGVSGNPLIARWAAGHVGQDLLPDDAVDASDRAVFPATDSGSADDWHMRTMDPRSRYKLQCYRWMAQAVGQWLAELREEYLAQGVDIARYFAGIELGNELGDRHVLLGSDGLENAEGDGVSWGSFYYWCASGIWEHADWVPLWLPAMASYSLDEKAVRRPTLTWGGRYRFLSAAMRQVDTLCDANPFAYPDVGPGLSDLIQGLDLHHYHDRTDHEPLSLLAADLASLRALLESFALADTSLTVQEAGVNVLGEDPATDATPEGAAYDWACESSEPRTDAIPAYDSFTGYPSDAGAAPPPSDRPPRVSAVYRSGAWLVSSTAAGAGRYQALSLWMRWAAARAGGADILGWHTPMSTYGGAFFAMGLRRDQHASDGDPAQAVARAAYGAYQRASALFATYRTVRRLDLPGLAWPTPGDGETPHDAWESLRTSGSFSPEHHVWIVQLSDPGDRVTAPYAYLLFLDPDRTAGVDAARVRMQPASRRLSAPTITRAVLEPSSQTDLISAGEFPSASWTYPAPTARSPLSGMFGYQYEEWLGKSHFPILWTSNCALRVASLLAEDLGSTTG